MTKSQPSLTHLINVAKNQPNYASYLCLETYAT
jgi:hypothetical protein